MYPFTFNQLRALLAVAAAGGVLSQGQLERRTGIARTTLNDVIDVLAAPLFGDPARPVVLKTRSAKGERSPTVLLLPGGDEVVEEAITEFEQVARRLEGLDATGPLQICPQDSPADNMFLLDLLERRDWTLSELGVKMNLSRDGVRRRVATLHDLVQRSRRDTAWTLSPVGRRSCVHIGKDLTSMMTDARAGLARWREDADAPEQQLIEFESLDTADVELIEALSAQERISMLALVQTLPRGKGSVVRRLRRLAEGGVVTLDGDVAALSQHGWSLATVVAQRWSMSLDALREIAKGAESPVAPWAKRPVDIRARNIAYWTVVQLPKNQRSEALRTVEPDALDSDIEGAAFSLRRSGAIERDGDGHRWLPPGSSMVRSFLEHFAEPIDRLQQRCVARVASLEPTASAVEFR